MEPLYARQNYPRVYRQAYATEHMSFEHYKNDILHMIWHVSLIYLIY